MFKGGFLSGKKTYFVAAAAVLASFIEWAVTGEAAGGLDLGGFIQTLFSPEVLGGLGLASLRAGVAKAIS